MNFDVDSAGTAILVAVTGVFWFFTFGPGMSPTAMQTLVVVAISALTLTETGTISFGTSSTTEPVPDKSEPTPATDGGDRRDDA